MIRKPRCLLMMPLLAMALPGAASEPPSEVEQRKSGAREVTKQLAQALSSELQTAMKEGGPEAAIKVCRDRAPQISSRLSRETGWQITRVGTRVRNPLLGTPDAYEARVLSQFQQRMEAGDAKQPLEHTGIQNAADSRYFRYMKAIKVKPQCLGCHGPVEDQPEAIRAALKEQYPSDQAVGYNAGELRGAFSVLQDMTAPYEAP
ncbi:DUF3365 domain-containing protein [Halomonadaceae bacterium KBTZ08]